MRLDMKSAEYQLAVYMGGGSQYVKHRDALPDDGADPNQRRVGSRRSLCFAVRCNLAVLMLTIEQCKNVAEHEADRIYVVADLVTCSQLDRLSGDCMSCITVCINAWENGLSIECLGNCFSS